MKVLYALPKTGNGHIARSESIIPILKKYVDCDVLVSGRNSQLNLIQTPKYDLSGISLFYGSDKGVSYLETAKKNNFYKAIKDVFTLDLSSYDLIINDYEPISAWNAKLNKIPIVSLSHQASMSFKETPTHKKFNFVENFMIHNYTPSKYTYGFHFQSYHENIFTPIIRDSVRNIIPETKEHYVVYLPAYSLQATIDLLKQIPVQWKIFHKDALHKTTIENCECFPISNETFTHFFQSCKGVLCNSGFELPAESMFLSKKLFCIPLKNQFEQLFNLKSLELLGVTTFLDLTIQDLLNWIESDKIISFNYPDQTEEIILKVLATKF